jgi:anti-sigma factor RsiW
MNANLHTLTGAYAVDALDDRERGQFERHLAACPECADEVAELRLTANRLGTAISEDPPAHLREQVLTRIHQVRQDPPGLRLVRRRGPASRRQWVTGLTSAAAAIALALAVTFGAIAAHTQAQLNSAQGQLAAAAVRYAPVGQVLGAPDVRSVSASGTAGGNATVMVSRRLNKLVFLAFHMPAVATGKTYQAWAIGAGNPRSMGLMTLNADDSTVPLVLDSLTNTAKIAVTVEPSGGSRQPTSRLVMLFSVPA